MDSTALTAHTERYHDDDDRWLAQVTELQHDLSTAAGRHIPAAHPTEPRVPRPSSDHAYVSASPSGPRKVSWGDDGTASLRRGRWRLHCRSGVGQAGQVVPPVSRLHAASAPGETEIGREVTVGEVGAAPAWFSWDGGACRGPILGAGTRYAPIHSRELIDASGRVRVVM